MLHSFESLCEVPLLYQQVINELTHGIAQIKRDHPEAEAKCQLLLEDAIQQLINIDEFMSANQFPCLDERSFTSLKDPGKTVENSDDEG